MDKLALDAKPRIRPLHEALSWREYQVFEALVAGKALTEIAEELHVSNDRKYLSILGKTHVKTDTDLVRYAIHHKLVAG